MQTLLMSNTILDSLRQVSSNDKILIQSSKIHSSTHIII